MCPDHARTPSPSDPHPFDTDLHWLRGVALRYVRDWNEADDLAQDAVVAYLETQVPIESRRAWLVGVLKRLVHKRRARLHLEEHRQISLAEVAESGFEAVFAASSESEAAIAELQARLTSLLRCLSDDDRALLTQRYLDGLSLKAVAAARDLPVETAKTRLRRALVKVRRILASGGPPRMRPTPLATSIPRPGAAQSQRPHDREHPHPRPDSHARADEF